MRFCFYVFMWIALCVSADQVGIALRPNAGRITLRNASNSVMGYIDGGSGKVAVKDKNNKLIGYVDHNNTWSKGNRKIARSRLPGLLLCK